MAVEIVMPRVDMDMSSGRMGRWHAAEGAHVVKGATLFEIETDKAAMEVDAPASGVLKFVAASEGDVLPVGACIGWVVAEGETFIPPMAKADAAKKLPPKTPPAVAGRKSKAGHAEPALGARPRATPAARRVARGRGLRLEIVSGSGPHGRVQRRDIEAARVSAPSDASVHRLWLQRGGGAPIVF